MAHEVKGMSQGREVKKVRPECTKPKVWNAGKSRCDCPKISKCFTIGAVFNPETCTWCIPQKCEKGKVFNNQTCKCECEPHDIPAQEWVWDDNKCEAVCNRSCSPPYVVNSTSCTCGCPKTSTLSKKDSLIKAWNNATCKDECKESTKLGDGADNGLKAFNATTCTYECKNAEPVRGCGDMRLWLKDTCSCACSNVLSCEFPFIFDDNPCDCTCGLNNADAPVGKFLNIDSCAFECKDKKPVFDETIKQWNETSCAVECKESTKQEFGAFIGKKAFNSTTCTFECKSTEPVEGCGIRLWDDYTCECRCDLKDPEFNRRKWRLNSDTCNLDCISQAPNPQPPNSRWNPKTCMTECTECPYLFGRSELNQENPDCTCKCLTKPYCDLEFWSETKCTCIFPG